MISTAALLEQLEGYVELIDSVIENKNWDELNETLIRRQDILEELCRLPLSSHERGAVVKIMTLMQMTDRQFIALVQAQKEVLQKQAALLAHDRKAIQAYQIE
ncbi:MAG: flagellar protein FliT [Methylococcaceae bacterium]|nr:flagellar protein FliT [Methylococcaceae bacterium]MDP3905348.1 flagellar protein FliT [Methylococcaceae bacterium]